VADQLQALCELAYPAGHVLLMLAQEGQPVLFVAGYVPDELGVAADRGQRHAGAAQACADGQLLHVLLAADATPAQARAVRD
jgi:hypothetical protein